MNRDLTILSKLVNVMHLKLYINDKKLLTTWLYLTLPDYLTTWLPDAMTTWLPDYLTTWLPDYLTTWLPDYLATWLPDYLTNWLSAVGKGMVPEPKDKVAEAEHAATEEPARAPQVCLNLNYND